MHDEDSVVINRPTEDVWAFVTDLFNAPRVWGNGWVALRQTSPGSLGVGSTLQGRMVILGFETRSNYVITEWDPPHALGLSMAARWVRSYDARITLETIDDGTKMVRSVGAEARGLLRLALPFIWPYLIRQRHAMTRNLKQFIEAKPR